MRVIVVAVLVALLSACGGSSVKPTTPIDATLSIGLGQTALVAGTSIGVRFDSVVEDSRCPLKAMCVTAGQAVVQVSVSGSGRDRSVELRSEPSSARVANVDDVRVEWAQLKPYPYAGQPTAPKEYRLTVTSIR